MPHAGFDPRLHALHLFSPRFFDEGGSASGLVASFNVSTFHRRRWCVVTMEHFRQIQCLRISRQVYSSTQASSVQLAYIRL